MLCGVLRMAPELWIDDQTSLFQVLARMREAADELEKRAAEIERLRARYEGLDRTSERELSACERERDEALAQLATAKAAQAAALHRDGQP